MEGPVKKNKLQGIKSLLQNFDDAVIFDDAVTFWWCISEISHNSIDDDATFSQMHWCDAVQS